MRISELFEELERRGCRIRKEDENHIRVSGPLDDEIRGAIRENKERILLTLEKGTHQALCYGCGKTTTFYPTHEVMDVFRRWECGECGWKLWRREEGAYHDGTLEAIIRAFRGSVVKYNPKKEEVGTDEKEESFY